MVHPPGRPTGQRFLLLSSLLAVLAWACLAAAGQRPPTAAASATAETRLAPGVTYRHLSRATPAGEPWSIHVLEIARGETSVVVRAVAGRGSRGEMHREFPTEMAARAARDGADVLAVVNGDFDLGEPYLGIPVGLSVTSGRLWTTGRSGRPVLGFFGASEPVIAVPEVKLELSARSGRWAIVSLNKPPGFESREGLRLYTREYGAAVKSARPFRAVVVGRLSPGLLLRVDAAVRGEVVQVDERTREVAIPADGLVLVTRHSEPSPAAKPERANGSTTGLHRGDKVKLRIALRLNGRKGVRDAVGGFPILVENGGRVAFPSADAPAPGAESPGEYLRLRHPRTAACYNDHRIIFVVVDGRQPQLSVGMTLAELADLMVSLGCTAAMNGDGGGSSVMAVALPRASGSSALSGLGASSAARSQAPNFKPPASNFQIVNSPSDGKERGRGNAWLILRKQ